MPNINNIISKDITTLRDSFICQSRVCIQIIICISIWTFLNIYIFISTNELFDTMQMAQQCKPTFYIFIANTIFWLFLKCFFHIIYNLIKNIPLSVGTVWVLRLYCDWKVLIFSIINIFQQTCKKFSNYFSAYIQIIMFTWTFAMQMCG